MLGGSVHYGRSDLFSRTAAGSRGTPRVQVYGREAAAGVVGAQNCNGHSRAAGSSSAPNLDGMVSSREREHFACLLHHVDLTDSRDADSQHGNYQAQVFLTLDDTQFGSESLAGNSSVANDDGSYGGYFDVMSNINF
jgi:hypothetical protein